MPPRVRARRFAQPRPPHRHLDCPNAPGVCLMANSTSLTRCRRVCSRVRTSATRTFRSDRTASTAPVRDTFRTFLSGISARTSPHSASLAPPAFPPPKVFTTPPPSARPDTGSTRDCLRGDRTYRSPIHRRPLGLDRIMVPPPHLPPRLQLLGRRGIWRTFRVTTRTVRPNRTPSQCRLAPRWLGSGPGRPNISRPAAIFCRPDDGYDRHALQSGRSVEEAPAGHLVVRAVPDRGHFPSERTACRLEVPACLIVPERGRTIGSSGRRYRAAAEPERWANIAAARP